MLARCERLRRATGGWFDVRATGRLDPSGFVKGWAVDGAVAILRAAGARNLCVHAGGDVRVLGERAPGLPVARSACSTRRGATATAAVLHAPAGRPRGRDVGRVRARRPHRRPAHRPPAARPALGDRLRAGPRHGRRLRDRGVRDGDGRAGVDGDAAAAYAAMTILDARHGALDPRDGRAARRVERDRGGRGDGETGRPIATTSDSLDVLRASLRERLAACAASRPSALPPAMLDIRVLRVRVPGGDVFLVRPADWEQLRHEEGGAGRGVPYWATPWPSGAVLAGAVAEDPPPPGARVLELGCGLGLPSIVAAREGAYVLATDGISDAVVFAAHSLALNELDGEVAEVDWAEQADALVARGPWDLVLAADVLYLRAGVEAALALMPRLVAPGGEIRMADPRRAGARDFLAAARATFTVRTRQEAEIALHRLTPKPPGRRERHGAARGRLSRGASPWPGR